MLPSASSLGPPPLTPRKSAAAVESVAERTRARSNLISFSEPIDMTAPHNGFFLITSVHRDDLEGLGYDTSRVDDATMSKLASKLADAYCQSTFWIDLPIIADFLGIPKREDE